MAQGNNRAKTESANKDTGFGSLSRENHSEQLLWVYFFTVLTVQGCAVELNVSQP